MTSLVFILACLVLAYTGFCRLVRISSSTRFSVRMSLYLLTVAASTAFVAVVAWGFDPDWPSAMLACAMAFVQMATSRQWRDGVPMSYRAGA